MTLDGVLTLAQTAEMFGVSTKTIRTWELKRIIPLGIRFGHTKVYRKADIEIIINKRFDERLKAFKRGM